MQSAIAFQACPARNLPLRISLPCRDSDILMIVRRRLIYLFFALIIAAASSGSASAQAPPGAAPGQAAPQIPTQASTSSRTPLTVVVVDPAHGGPDQGAHGSSGIVESNVVLNFALLLRASLQAQGLRVVLTRQDDQDPSFDDRSKIANAQSRSIFITLHVSSTGQPGTVRVYSLPPPAPPPVTPPPGASSPGTTSPGTPPATPPSGTVAAPSAGLVPWDHAQSGFIAQSRRLAELIQIQMAQRFPGTAEIPFTAAVRQLRTIAAPAVAIEVSSVTIPDRAPLDQMGPGLADGVARAVAAFRTIYAAGGN